MDPPKVLCPQEHPEFHPLHQHRLLLITSSSHLFPLILSHLKLLSPTLICLEYLPRGATNIIIMDTTTTTIIILSQQEHHHHHRVREGQECQG